MGIYQSCFDMFLCARHFRQSEKLGGRRGEFYKELGRDPASQSFENESLPSAEASFSYWDGINIVGQVMVRSFRCLHASVLGICCCSWVLTNFIRLSLLGHPNHPDNHRRGTMHNGEPE